jgi:putative MATE family efflux protein
MQESTKNVLDDSRIGRLLFKLTLPAFMGMFVMSLYNVVDTIFIGRYVGSLAIAGLSIVFPVQMLTMGVGMITGMGGASLISRLIGAKNIARAERTLGNANLITLVFSIILMIIGLSNTDTWLRLMGASETILPYAREYMTIILIGMFFVTYAMSQNNMVRAEGNARVAMIGVIIGAGLNIVLDAIFIIPLNMGVAGAAWATVIAQAVSAVYFLLYYLSGQSYLKMRLKNMIIDWSIVKGIMAIGMAAFAMTVAGSVSGMIVNRTIGAYGGDLAISAFGVLNRVMMFSIMPGIVIGQGLQPIVGFNYGAKRFGLALKAIKIAVISSTVICIAAFGVLYGIPQIIMGIFTTDAELITLASEAARIMFLGIPFIGILMVGEMCFMALGKAVQAFVTSLARPALFLIPFILILSQFWSLNGIWMAFPSSDILTMILVIFLAIPMIRTLQRKDSAELEPVTVPEPALTPSQAD